MAISIYNSNSRNEVTSRITGRISKFESLGAVDGPGLRYVVFFQGCNLRCSCCHNPETWEASGGSEFTSTAVIEQALRYRSYFGENGGVTFSGGEPLMQVDFLTECAILCKSNGINTVLDTSGSILNDKVSKMLKFIDLVMLDIKMTSEKEYLEHTGGSLKDTLRFLDELQRLDKNVWIRQVIIPTINDNNSNIKKLKAIAKKYSCVKKLEFLPFKKLCESKYTQLGLDFKLSHIPECKKELIEELDSNM